MRFRFQSLGSRTFGYVFLFFGFLGFSRTQWKMTSTLAAYGDIQDIGQVVYELFLLWYTITYGAEADVVFGVHSVWCCVTSSGNGVQRDC